MTADAISRHTVQDFIENPKLQLNNPSNAPWENPDHNRSLSKLGVYGFSLTCMYLFTLTPAQLAWLQGDLSPVNFLLLSSFLAGLISFWVPTCSYYVLYYLDLPFMEKYKVDKSTPWKWDSKRIAKDFAHVLFGQVVYGPPTMLASFYLLPLRIDMRPETAPTWYMNIFWIYVAAFVFEIFFYWAHRLSHTAFNGWVYQNIHRMHHDLKPCYGIGSMYHHPLDSIITQWTPFHLAASILGLHVSTYLTLSILLTMIGVDEHSGYSFPFSPFRLFYGNADTDFHYFHHTHSGLGNYAAPLMDWLFGSDGDFRKQLDAKQARLLAEAKSKST